MTLYTVEYEEQHAGQTAAGVEQFWFKRIEPFAEGIFDDPFRRATDRMYALAESSAYRAIKLVRWEQLKVLAEINEDGSVRQNVGPERRPKEAGHHVRNYVRNCADYSES